MGKIRTFGEIWVKNSKGKRKLTQIRIKSFINCLKNSMEHHYSVELSRWEGNLCHQCRYGSFLENINVENMQVRRCCVPWVTSTNRTHKQAAGNVKWNSKNTWDFNQWHKPNTKTERDNAIKSRKRKLSNLSENLAYQDRKTPCKSKENKCT